MERFSRNSKLVREIVRVELDSNIMCEEERVAFMLEFERLWGRLRMAVSGAVGTNGSDSAEAERVSNLAAVGVEGMSNEENQEPSTADVVEMESERTLTDTLWGCIEGGTRPAVVIHVNFLVKQDGCFSPCEIGLTAFTLGKGIINTYSAIFEPVCVLRPDTRVRLLGSEKSAVRQLFPDEEEQDLKLCREKLEKIEEFISYHAHGDPIFCLSRITDSMRQMLVALYAKFDRRFNSDILSLEELMVALSKSGLMVVAENEEVDLNFVTDSIALAAETYRDDVGDEPRMTIEELQKLLGFESVLTKDYTNLGRPKRLAASNLNYTAVVLGAFLNEEEAMTYLEFQWNNCGLVGELACRLHDLKSSATLKNRKYICAVGVTKSLAYLIIDALLLHFPHPPRVGRHYPYKLQPPLNQAI